MSDEGLVKITGLWVNKAKDGSTFYSGKLGYGAKVVILKNGFKKKDTDPDLNLFIAKAEEKRDGAGSGTGDKEPF